MEENLLDWDEDVPAPQGRVMLDGLDKRGIPGSNRVRRNDALWTAAKNLRDGLYRKTLSGEYVYRSLQNLLGSAKAASEFLYSVGIHGITYIGDSSNERNYVAFSDKDIRIDRHIMYQADRKPGDPEDSGSDENRSYTISKSNIDK